MSLLRCIYRIEIWSKDEIADDTTLKAQINRNYTI